MAKLRLQPFEDMGDPAILLNTDQDGIRIFQSAVRRAHESGEATFEFDGIKHQVVREDGAADIELGPQTVVWRFDDAKLLEMLDLMMNSNSPGHQYVDDLKSPVELLVLSHHEYKGPLNYGEFSQLYPGRRSGVFAHSQPRPEGWWARSRAEPAVSPQVIMPNRASPHP